jgi:hypothetical protein
MLAKVMLTEEVRALLEKPLIARMSVIDANGFPHTVPVWFALDGDDVVIISVCNTRKVDYLRINPKGAVVIGGDEGAGYLFKGMFTIEPDNGWTRRVTARYEAPEKVDGLVEEWLPLGMIVLRLKITRVLKVA